MATKLEIHQESLRRVRAIEFGEPVTNICSGERNPMRFSFFVELVIKQHKNRYGVVHRDYWAKCTDRKGKFWNTGIEVIYPGHLSYEKCNELFAPVHAAMFGS